MTERLAAVTPGTTKDDLLAALVPAAARDEVMELQLDGVRADYGSTDDAAYDHPLAIRDMFVRLREAGVSYDNEVGRIVPFGAARIAALAAAAPVKPLRTWGKGRVRARRSITEGVRGRLMYDLPEVQGQPWHQQNGRATSLVTIVDALDLATPSSDGLYPRASGRLDASVLDLTFGSETGWLEGLTVAEAVTQAAMRFRGWDRTRAAKFSQRELEEVRTFVTAPAHEGFKEIVSYCFDALGIRSRKEEVRHEILGHAERAGHPGRLMLSIGCGTALPMLEALASLRTVGAAGRLILIDQDPIALASARTLADQMGLGDALEIHCERLILGRGRGTRVLDLEVILKGRRVDVCEDSGLREYFPDFLYVELAAKAWNVTKPGGLVTTGNMNSNRPQPEFLHGMMGWPIQVQMRTMRKVHDLHVQAGVPQELLRLRLTQDGVYTLCFISKPGSA